MLQTPAQFHIIKTCILDVHEDQLPTLKDDYKNLVLLCDAIEKVFRLGFRPRGLAHVRKRDFYSWMELIPQLCDSEGVRCSIDFCKALDSVRSNSNVQTLQGRGRLLIRHLLQCGKLDYPVNFMQSHFDFAAKFYDTSYAVLTDEISIQIFSSLIAQACRLPFKLQLDNAAFLDETWHLPEFEKLEFVPCVKLGVHLETVEGHSVVTYLDLDGVAAEDDKVQLGDIFCTMYGHNVRYSNRHILSWRETNVGKPVPVGLVKARMSDGSVYPPLERLVEYHGMGHLLPKAVNSPSQPYPCHFNRDEKCRLVLLGCCDVGPNGSVQMINGSINKVIANRNPEDKAVPVYMELGELGITVWKIDPKTGSFNREAEPLLRHPFPQVSSCGRRTDRTNYLAYIVGTEACTVSKQFKCYVFQAIDGNDAKCLVSGMAQGFERTHWTL